MSDYLPLPKVTDRTKGQKYMYNEEIVIWNGKRRLCEHGKQKSRCKECGGSGICEHNRQKERCKECGGSQICEHNRIRSNCKECGGSQICEHNRRKGNCKECGGSQICEHNRRKDRCIECGGSQICEHNRQKDRCKECGGSGICEHNRIRSICKECGGGQICEHNTERQKCKVCKPNGYLVYLMRMRVYSAMKNYSRRRDKKHTFEYIGCSVEDLRTHLENQFDKEAERSGHPISWENKGEWHIDHIKPCASFDLELEDERHKCFHYTNLQPMWGSDNISKSDTYDEDEDEREWNDDKWN